VFTVFHVYYCKTRIFCEHQTFAIWVSRFAKLNTPDFFVIAHHHKFNSVLWYAIFLVINCINVYYWAAEERKCHRPDRPWQRVEYGNEVNCRCCKWRTSACTECGIEKARQLCIILPVTGKNCLTKSTGKSANSEFSTFKKSQNCDAAKSVLQ